MVWRLETGESQTWRSPTYSPLRAVKFSADGRWLIAAGADRTVELWDARQDRFQESLSGHRQEIYCLDIDSAGDRIASGDAGGIVRLWHASSRRLLATLTGHTASVMALRFTPDGRALVSASLDGTVRVWDLDYYARHIAGNVESHIQRLSQVNQIGPAHLEAWRQWAAINSGGAD
jgi:WD40 repeat protein